jgi:hypothetical protein
MIFVILLSVVLLTACDFGKELTSADVLAEIKDAMDNAPSYEADGEITMTVFVLGDKMELDGTQKTVYSKNADEGMYFCSKNDTTAEYKGEEVRLVVTDAYNGGSYFLTCITGGDSTKLRSEMTEDEFEEFYKNLNDNIDIFEGYGEISHVKNEDGTYTVSLSKYDEKTISTLNKKSGFPLENGGGKIVDCAVTVEADADFRMNKVTVDYVFSNSSFSGKQTMSFSKYGEAEKELKYVDTDRYTEVSNAGAVRTLKSLLTDRTESENGSLVFDYVMEVMVAGQKQTRTEKTTVTYGRRDGAYTFEANCEVDGTEYEITYKDGVFKTNGEETPGYNDYTAKQFVSGQLIDPFNFSMAGVENITQKNESDGSTVYELKMAYNSAFIEKKLGPSYEAIGAEYDTASATLTITVKDNAIKTIEYKVNSYGSIEQGNSSFGIGISMTTATRFD